MVHFVAHVLRSVGGIEVEGKRHVSGCICKVKASDSRCNGGIPVFGR